MLEAASECFSQKWFKNEVRRLPNRCWPPRKPRKIEAGDGQESQDAPQSVPERSKGVPETAKRCPKAPPRRPRGSQKAPKSSPNRSKTRPGDAQTPPKSSPVGPKMIFRRDVRRKCLRGGQRTNFLSFALLPATCAVCLKPSKNICFC